MPVITMSVSSIKEAAQVGRASEYHVGLHGGQKQRISIAWALLKNPKFLIFDEATSTLDGLTAEAFAQTINRLKGKVTMLFITHVLPKALVVDRVWVLTGKGLTEFPHSH